MKVKTKTKGKTLGGRAGKLKPRGPRTRRDGASMRKRFCRLCADKTKSLDYKDVKRLEAFMNDRGKIVSSRLSGNCAKHQRRVAEAIQKARFLSLVPYTR